MGLGVNLDKHRADTALPLATGEFSAGTAERNSPDKDKACQCDPLDFKCLLKCTKEAMTLPKKCYEKCDNTMCHQECVYVEIDYQQHKKAPASVGSTPETKAAKDTPKAEGVAGGETKAAIGGEDGGEGGGKGGSKDKAGKEAAGLNLCEPGQFSATGQKPCEDCAEGSYMPSSGARGCVRCAQGTFQNRTGATSCDSCEGGDSATTASAGATSAQDCGAFPAVTGIQYMRYENQAEEETILDGHTAVGDDSDWQPTPFGGALGPWFGGWWIAVYGKNLGKKSQDLDHVRIGDVPCRKSVWLSASSSACMVPRGMGWKMPVTVHLSEGLGEATVPNKFSYEAPIVDSYHPRNGPPRGGFWVTISGRNFGFLDTSPVAAIGGRICLETYWMSNTQIVARGPPGVGGPSMLHHVDLTFETAEHVQEMPRRLRGMARSVVQASAHSVSAKQNASKPLVEIDVKAAADPAGKALVRKGDKAAYTAPAKRASTATSLTALKEEWAEREREVKAELSAIKENAKDEELNLLATYLERVEDRDKEREEHEKAERARRLAEYQAVLDAEKKIRAEEEAAARKRSEEAELRKALDKGSVEKKLDKFTKAREAARKKKLAGDAAAALRDVKACSDLVTVGFQSGKLSTTEALASPLCKVGQLELAANKTKEAGMSETEAAKKIVALLFEIRVGLDNGRKSLKIAEAEMSKTGKLAGTELMTVVKAAKDALGKARAAFESAGLAGSEELIAVAALETTANKVLDDVSRAAEEERVKHQEEAAAAVSLAKSQMAAGKFGEALAAHGTASIEYELAGMKQDMMATISALEADIKAAEEVQKIKDEAAAAEVRKQRDAAEKKKKEEDEQKRLEEEEKRKVEEEQRLQKLAEQEVCAHAATPSEFACVLVCLRV